MQFVILSDSAILSNSTKPSIVYRIGYMAAREGHMVSILCYLHKTQQTPSPAVVVQVNNTFLCSNNTFPSSGSSGITTSSSAVIIQVNKTFPSKIVQANSTFSSSTSSDKQLLPL